MNTARISFSGDLLCTGPLLDRCALPGGGRDFAPLFRRAAPVFAESGFVVVNLESPVAGESFGLTNERYRFNTPVAFVREVRDQLRANLVTLANNHSMDRGEAGLDATLVNLRALGLDTVGTYRTPAERDRIYVRDIAGVRVAFLNYTYGSNAFAHHDFLPEGHGWRVDFTQPEETREGSIHLLDPMERIQARTEELYGRDGRSPEPVVAPYLERMRRDVVAARAVADVVFFCLHSGGQYNPDPDAYSRMLMNRIREWGADLVVGLHPHIIQRCEARGDAPPDVYCLGNLLCLPSICTENKWGVDCSFNAVLHAEVDPVRKRLARLSFSLLRVVEPEDGGAPFVADAFDLCAEGALDPALALQYANRFAGADRYASIQREYPLWEAR